MVGASLGIRKPHCTANPFKSLGPRRLRIGICIAHPEVIALLNKIKPPYNINSFTQAEALRRLTESD